MPSNTPDPRKPAAESPPTPATAPGAGVAPPSPPEPSQAALDKEATKLQEKADAEAQKAAELAAAAQAAENAAEDFGEPRAPRCPDCGERMEPYTGGDANPHKVGTAFCHRCGRRRRVSRNKVID